MRTFQIDRVFARRVLDSRGWPTVEATVILRDGVSGTASVPSGASTGSYEAAELRDGGDAYLGRDVQKAIANVNGEISRALRGRNAGDQNSADKCLIELDGTEYKTRLGANAILAVSLAVARAASNACGMPLFRYLGGVNAVRLPVPMMNILNGGAHAANALDIQEFMIVPRGFGSFSEAVRAGSEIYHTLRGLLKNDGLSTAVGDEGGFAPELSDAETALDYITKAIKNAGYSSRVKLALDAAASEWTSLAQLSAEVKSDIVYSLPKSGRVFTSDELIEYYGGLCDKYHIVSIEDGLGEDDGEGWRRMTATLGTRTGLVGDDLFATNAARLADGIENNRANAVLVKPNQAGTLSETLRVCRDARLAGYKIILSHRSGDTADTFIADIAAAVGADGIKSGAPCRSERCEKYNRLMKIEMTLSAPEFAGNDSK